MRKTMRQDEKTWEPIWHTFRAVTRKHFCTSVLIGLASSMEAGLPPCINNNITWQAHAEEWS